MSQENVELVRGLYRDLSRRDLASVAAKLGAGVEWDTEARGSDGALVYGIEGVAKAIQEWLDAWEDASFEVREVRDAGDQIAAHLRQHATAKISGIEGDVDAGPAGAFEPPARLEPGAVLRDEPWQYGEEDVVAARVLVDASQAAAVVDQVGESAVTERRDDGSVVLELPVTNTAAFRSFVLGLLDAAEVVAPPELRAEMVAWLEGIARGAA